LPNPLDLIFVDNGSDGKLHEWVEKQFPEITVIRLSENRYFCGGYNAGIRVAMERGYDFVLIANADTEVVNQGFLTELLKTATLAKGCIHQSIGLFSIDQVVRKHVAIPELCAMLLFGFRGGFSNYFQKQAKKKRLSNSNWCLCSVQDWGFEEFGLMDENMGVMLKTRIGLGVLEKKVG
jgi:GT2 family glycosyltransferase